MDSQEKKFPSFNRKEDEEACLDALLFSNSHVFPMALHAAIQLDLFNIMAKAGTAAYISPSEIASQLPTQNPEAPSMLDRMLRLFASHSLLTYSLRTLEDGSVERLYRLAPACKFFLRNQDELSLAPLSALDFHRANVEVWLHMKDIILEGGNLFKKIHGMSVYQYMGKDPTFNTIFNQAMSSISFVTMNEILEVYKGFEGLTLLVDVGGGTGKTLDMIISKYPSIKGINYDLPHVTQSATSFPGIEHVGGDMFSSVPKGDAIMIKSTCHTLKDEDCIKVLKNCYEALPKNGKMMIVDLVMAEAPDSSRASKYVSRADTIMLTFPGGKERTAKEFESLCKSAGFHNFQVACCIHGILAVMESYK